MTRINRDVLIVGIAALVPLILGVLMFWPLQSSSSEMLQNVIVAVVAIVAFWLLFTFIGARYSFKRSALQEWLLIMYLWIMGVFVGLYFGVRGEHPDLGRLYSFSAITMICAFMLYDKAALPLIKRRRSTSNETLLPKN